MKRQNSSREAPSDRGGLHAVPLHDAHGRQREQHEERHIRIDVADGQPQK